MPRERPGCRSDAGRHSGRQTGRAAERFRPAVPGPCFQGQNRANDRRLEARFSAADRGAARRAQYPAYPHRRRGLRRVERLRRPDSDADFGSARCEGDQIQRVQHDRALLTDARGALDRARSAQSPSRHHHGAKPWLSGLQFLDAEERGNDRGNPARNGYSTAWFGKNHNVPGWQSSAAGPFDLWPTGLGFDYFYGFIGGDTDQWDPTLFENTAPIEPKEKLTGAAKAAYNLDSDLADQAIHWIQQQHSLAPNKPFFAYYAPGATHAPHHVPKEWIAKFKGQFDQGWDKLREETFARQKALGIIPQDAILTPRPANLPAWDSLDAKHKELFAHMAEVYAAFLAYDDHNIGRVIDAVTQEGLADNTLIIFIEGDNGGSAEGTLQGTANEIATIGNRSPETFDYLYSIKDELGGPLYYNHMPVPWSWAFNTPFQWTKRYASHFGGTRNGMVMSWPKRIKSDSEPRQQFHYVTDIMPTILDAAGIQAPESINGVQQMPIDGTSMAYTWNHADAPSQRTTQLFEMFGNRGIYHDGWMASTTPLVFAWEPEPKGITPESFNWELYDLTKDFSQGHDLAKAEPAKLKEMEELWWAEAGRNNALPLNFSHRRLSKPSSSGRALRAGAIISSIGRAPCAFRRARTSPTELILRAFFPDDTNKRENFATTHVGAAVKGHVKARARHPRAVIPKTAEERRHRADGGHRE